MGRRAVPVMQGLAQAVGASLTGAAPIGVFLIGAFLIDGDLFNAPQPGGVAISFLLLSRVSSQR
jgi:hypothetical protein